MSDLLAHLAPSINVVPNLVTMLGHTDNTITATELSPCHAACCGRLETARTKGYRSYPCKPYQPLYRRFCAKLAAHDDTAPTAPRGMRANE